MRLTLALALAALPAAAALADPPVLRLDGTARETAARLEDPGRLDFPIAAFDGDRVPMQQVDGRLDLRAFVLPGSGASTLSLMRGLEDQLRAAGWQVVFACEADACGGFDFRYGMAVLPEPGMHVDLGDFRYLAAEDGKGGMASLLVSRALDQGFVQIASVTASAPAQKAAVRPENTLPDPADAAAPEAPRAEPAPEPPTPAAGSLAERLAAGGAAALDDLVFASGKAELAAGDYASLTELAAWLANNPTLRVTLVGHTDATGSLAANIALSRARAQAVRDKLVAGLGADGARIGAEGAGYLAPRASNQTPEGRQRNRRVEVMLTSVAE